MYCIYCTHYDRERVLTRKLLIEAAYFRKTLISIYWFCTFQFNTNVSTFWANCRAPAYLRLAAFTELLSHPYMIHCISFMAHMQTFRASQLPFTNDVISVFTPVPGLQPGHFYLVALSWPASPHSTQQLLCPPVYCFLGPCGGR